MFYGHLPAPYRCGWPLCCASSAALVSVTASTRLPFPGPAAAPPRSQRGVAQNFTHAHPKLEMLRDAPCVTRVIPLNVDVCHSVGVWRVWNVHRFDTIINPSPPPPITRCALPCTALCWRQQLVQCVMSRIPASAGSVRVLRRWRVCRRGSTFAAPRGGSSGGGGAPCQWGQQRPRSTGERSAGTLRCGLELPRTAWI